jgi:hypothetical protein
MNVKTHEKRERHNADIMTDMVKFLAMVRRSMLAARRTVPIPTDFDTALEALDIGRPDDQLLPYTIQPPTNPRLLPTPPPDDEFHNVVKLPPEFLGPGLDGQGELKRFSFSTKGLPALPSAHTFRGTAVLPALEKDIRKVRELATQEGKLGEQALRKLAGAVKLDAAHVPEVESSKKKPQGAPGRTKKWRTTVNLSEEAVFEETLRELLAKEPGKFELGPIVNSEKVYRMPDDVQLRRAQADGSAANDRQSSSATAGAAKADRMEL